MTREEAIRCLSVHSSTNGSGLCTDEQHYEAKQMAIKALEQESCEDAVSRQAVEDKLLKLCNQLEGIFANIRMQNQDESVCGLCEYDCPTPYECPGFDTEDCFKLAYEIRYKWQSTEDLHSVKPQEPKAVLYSGDGYADGYMVYDMAECPNCGRKFEYGDETWNCNFCPDCGQALNWERSE